MSAAAKIMILKQFIFLTHCNKSLSNHSKTLFRVYDDFYETHMQNKFLNYMAPKPRTQMVRKT